MTTTNVRKKPLPQMQVAESISVAKFQVNIIPNSRLAKTLTSCNSELRPSFVVPHPQSMEDSLVFMQFPSEIRTFRVQEGHYTVTAFSSIKNNPAAWAKTLQHWITNAGCAGEFVIGYMQQYNNDLSLCHYKYEGQEDYEFKFTVKHLKGGFNAKRLMQILNESNPYTFRMLIQHGEQPYIVLQKRPVSLPKQYRVLEYPEDSLDSPSLASDLSEVIEKQIDDGNIFEGAISFRGELFVVFSKSK